VPVETTLRLADVVEETVDVRTFRFDNSDGRLPLDYPGKFVKVCVPAGGPEVWRSFTISSSPTRPEVLDLTIKLNPTGFVSRWLFDHGRPGTELKLKGPQGGFFFDHERHVEPLVLVSAGSGITPMISIARFLKERNPLLPCTFVYGARTSDDILFQRECLQMSAELPAFKYRVTLSRPDDGWQGARGRVETEWLLSQLDEPAASCYFLCGPNDLMDSLCAGLAAAGVACDRVHTEQFHATIPSTA
jgi:ferredoxin-NADP reductase